jgi:hypothetical protein
MSYKAAIKEAFATAAVDVPIIETLEVSHSTAEGSIYLCKNSENLNLPLVLGGDPVTFIAAGIEFSLPEISNQGIQDLGIAISNIDLTISDFLQETTSKPNEPIKITYRPYMLNDLTQPQMDPPLKLSLAGVKINPFQVTGTATLSDIANRRFLTQNYNLNDFPAL